MSTEQMLEKYMLEHPEFWEFEDEVKEVERLKKLCRAQQVKHNCFCRKNYSQTQLSC